MQRYEDTHASAITRKLRDTQKSFRVLAFTRSRHPRGSAFLRLDNAKTRSFCVSTTRKLAKGCRSRDHGAPRCPGGGCGRHDLREPCVAGRVCTRGGPSRPGKAAADAGRRKHQTTYPELLASRRCRLIVLAVEVGGRFGAELADFLRLAVSRARAAPVQLLRSSSRRRVRQHAGMYTVQPHPTVFDRLQATWQLLQFWARATCQLPPLGFAATPHRMVPAVRRWNCAS